MRHTLKDYIEHYDPRTIQLVYGEHLVNINTSCKGSLALIVAFQNINYYFISFDNNNLVLDYTGELYNEKNRDFS